MIALVIALVALLGLNHAELSVWNRVMKSYARGNVTFFESIAGENGELSIQETEMPTISLLARNEPLVCEGILYTAHDSRRNVDSFLDRVRAEWAAPQNLCFLRINIDVPTRISGASVNPEIQRLWKRRTPNDPIVLVDRYKGGLLLMALIQKGMIKKQQDDGELPWIFYVDGDVGMTNTSFTLNHLTTLVKNAGHVKSMEERVRDDGRVSQLVGNVPDEPANREVHMLFPHGDCIMPKSYVQTGTILFRPSLLSGFVFEVLANSPYYVMEPDGFAMGDQAILDWLLTRMFGVTWQHHGKHHCTGSDFLRGCEDKSELSYVTKLNFPGTAQLPALIEDNLRLWVREDQQTPADALTGYIGFACPRWTNSPICDLRIRKGASQPFHYRQGDLLFHLYGCPKGELYSRKTAELLLEAAKESAASLPRSLYSLVRALTTR